MVVGWGRGERNEEGRGNRNGKEGGNGHGSECGGWCRALPQVGDFGRVGFRFLTQWRPCFSFQNIIQKISRSLSQQKCYIFILQNVFGSKQGLIALTKKQKNFLRFYVISNLVHE